MEEDEPCLALDILLVNVRIIPVSCVPRAAAVISAEEIAILRNGKGSLKIGEAAHIRFLVKLAVYIDIAGSVKLNRVAGQTYAALEKNRLKLVIKERRNVAAQPTNCSNSTRQYSPIFNL